jgi:hypothetical protein
MNIAIDRGDIRALQNSLGKARGRMPGQLASAVNKTSTYVRSQKAKDISREITIIQREIKKFIFIKRATKKTLTAISTLQEEKRPSLKRFKGLKQTSVGVEYQISRSGKKTVLQGFMGPRPGVIAGKLGGHAFKRVGKSRTPIVKLHGVSPWAVFVKNQMDKSILIKADKRLSKEIREKVRVNVLRASGLIKSGRR